MGTEIPVQQRAGAPGAPEIGSDRQMTDFSGVPYQGKVEQTCDRAPFLQGEYTALRDPGPVLPGWEGSRSGGEIGLQKGLHRGERLRRRGRKGGEPALPVLSRGAGETKPLQHRDKAWQVR